MANLVIGEIGKVLQLNLIQIDETTNPPTQGSLDLTLATKVEIRWKIGEKATVVTKVMQVISPTGGVVRYTFLSGDLASPPDLAKFGLFHFEVVVTMSSGTILKSMNVIDLTIRNPVT